MLAIADSKQLDAFPFSQVADWLAKGEVVPFVGAGASRVGCPGLPDGSGLATELVDAMGAAFPSESGELAQVAQFYESSFLDRPALYDYIHKRFEAELSETEPGEVARTLAAIPAVGKPLFVITTNYDSLIERAFRNAERPLCVITQNMRDPEQGATGVTLELPDGSTTQQASKSFQWDDARFPSGCVFLFKMHGSAHHAAETSMDDDAETSTDDVIITEDDYVDFMVNSGGLVSPYFPPAALTRAYKQRRFLFLGYSLFDWNFRTFLRVLVLRNALSGKEVLRHWAIQKEPAALQVELWGHRNVNVYDGDLGVFCERIREAWGS
jgi:hypothetical protein